MKFAVHIVSLLLYSSGLSSVAVDPTQPAPSNVQVARAEKIVSSIGLDDPLRSQHVGDLIARQYFDLSIIHAKRDAAILGSKATLNKRDSDETIAAARSEAEQAQDKLHAAFISKLSSELTPEQIEKVKDGMTYGVVPLTFRVYQQMLPDLTAEQKAQILAWLVEAREHAMDASTSEEKHAWFGKYKGRINNYLAKTGYDMKAAEKNLKKHG